MPSSTLDSRAYVLADADRAGLEVDHFAAHDQRALPALHDDDIDSVVMLLWESISVTIKQAEAVIAVVGQRFPRRVIRTDLLGERLVSLLQFGRLPDGEPHRVRSQDRDNKKPSGEETDGGLHRRSSFDVVEHLCCLANARIQRARAHDRAAVGCKRMLGRY